MKKKNCRIKTFKKLEAGKEKNKKFRHSLILHSPLHKILQNFPKILEKKYIEYLERRDLCHV